MSRVGQLQRYSAEYLKKPLSGINFVETPGAFSEKPEPCLADYGSTH